MRRVVPRPSAAMVVACLALLVALGGTSVAAVSQLARNSVGTAQLKRNAVTTPKIRKNAITSAKVRNRSLRAIDFAPGQIPAGPQGPPGPQGAQGPAGPAGEAATTLWAHVSSTGTIVRSSRAGITAAASGFGSATVLFPGDVSQCSFAVTLAGAPGETFAPVGEIKLYPPLSAGAPRSCSSR